VRLAHVMRTSFDIKLLVVPERLSMSQRGTFQAGLEAVNRSAIAIDPEISSATLTVDGCRSDAWDRALQSCPSDAPWRKLSPDQRLVLKLGDRESVAEVEVTP
jgi:hypothetical protein